MILITGAGGKTGRALVRALANSQMVRAFVHHEAQVEIVRSLGAQQVVVGDMYMDPDIQRAMQGVRAVYYICPNMSPDEIAIAQRIMHAAKQNIVEHFVYHSVLHPQTEKMPHHWQKLRVEEMLFESGLAFTIVQPAPYMQNLLAGWKNILEHGLLRVPYSIDSKFSFVDLQDVAEAAKIVLNEPGHINSTYELVGTSPLSYRDAAEILSRVLNRQVRAEQENIADWKLRAAVRSEHTLDSLSLMFEYYNQWGLTGNSNVLKWILKREPTSLEAFIRNTVREQAA